jgi:hypothetical protein
MGGTPQLLEEQMSSLRVLAISDRPEFEFVVAQSLRQAKLRVTTERLPLGSGSLHSISRAYAVIIDLEACTAAVGVRVMARLARVAPRSLVVCVGAVLTGNAQSFIPSRWPSYLTSAAAAVVDWRLVCDGMLLLRAMAAGTTPRIYKNVVEKIPAAGMGGILLQVAVVGACATLSVEDLAAHLGRSERSLQMDLKFRNMPSPRWVLEAGRVIVATSLSLQGLNPTQVSRSLGLSGPRAVKEEVVRVLDSCEITLENPDAYEQAVRVIGAALTPVADHGELIGNGQVT